MDSTITAPIPFLLVVVMGLFSVCFSQTMTSSISFTNHSYVDLNQFRSLVTVIRCISNRETCCSDSNNEAVWINPNGIVIKGRSDNFDNLFVHYQNGFVDLGVEDSTGVIPTPGIYKCNVQLAGPTNERSDVYVGLYTSGGMLLCIVYTLL